MSLSVRNMVYWLSSDKITSIAYSFSCKMNTKLEQFPLQAYSQTTSYCFRIDHRSFYAWKPQLPRLYMYQIYRASHIVRQKMKHDLEHTMQIGAKISGYKLVQAAESQLASIRIIALTLPFLRASLSWPSSLASTTYLTLSSSTVVILHLFFRYLLCRTLQFSCKFNCCLLLDQSSAFIVLMWGRNSKGSGILGSDIKGSVSFGILGS